MANPLIGDGFESDFQESDLARAAPTPMPECDDTPDPASHSAHTGFRLDIEGLRAVAVLAVVLFHAEMPGTSGGFVGVDVFFVISGFLITGLLWREVSTGGSVRLRRFYGARARRLLPASAMVGIVTAISSAVLLPALQARTVFSDGIASALYVSNYWFLRNGTDYFASDMPPSPFQHYWSLGVEEQFYLVWPALIIAVTWLVRLAHWRKDAHAAASAAPYFVVLALIAAVSFAMSVALTRVFPAAAFFQLPTRAWQLAAGGLVALTVGHWRRLPALPAAIAGWAGLAVIVLACIRLGGMPYPGIAALLPVIGAVLVIGAGCAGPVQGCGRILALPPMRAVGRVSYSLYLWHWPVLVLAPALVGHELGLAGRLIAALFSAVLAVLTMRFVENPLRLADSVRGSAVRSLALGAGATVTAVCVGVALIVVVPVPVGRGRAAPTLAVSVQPVPAGGNVGLYDAAVRNAFVQVEGAVTASNERRAVPSNLSPPLSEAAAERNALLLNGCMRSFAEVGQAECATGDTASPTTVALVGDSNAAMWNPAFQQAAALHHWRVETMAKMSCPMLKMPIKDPNLRREYTECEQWRGQIVGRLKAEHPRLVVLAMTRRYGDRPDWSPGFTPYDPAWIESLTSQVQQLRRTGAQVLVLGPIPDPQSVVPICVSGHLDDVAACSPPTSTAVNKPGIAAESGATKAGGGHYADLTALFCSVQRCPVVVGNTLVYFDQTHLTTEYSRLLAPAVGAIVDRALNRS